MKINLKKLIQTKEIQEKDLSKIFQQKSHPSSKNLKCKHIIFVVDISFFCIYYTLFMMWCFL